MTSTDEVATAPPMEDTVEYPFLHALLSRAAVTNDDAPSDEGERVKSASITPLNQLCPFCEEDVTTAEAKPVALLTCGHAYHTTCGRMFLSKGEGKECTMSVCQRTDSEVELAQAKRIMDAAIAREEFTAEDLKDPVMRRDIMVRIRSLMNSARQSGDVSKFASTEMFPDAEDDRRTEEAYRLRWAETRVGREGFSYVQKHKLLFPYMKNPIAVKKEVVTLSRLFQLEENMRREAREASEDAEGSEQDVAIHVDENSEDLGGRISMARFVSAGLTLSDIFFGLELKSWQQLCDLGFKKEHITDHTGDFAITKLADLYGIGHETLIKNEFGWSVNDIVLSGHTAKELSNIGLDFRRLYLDMDMTKDDLIDLGFTAKEWHETLRLDKKYLEKPLGINAVDLKLMRWSQSEFIKAFNLHPMEQRVLGMNEDDISKSSSNALLSVTPRLKTEAAEAAKDVRRETKRPVPVLNRLQPRKGGRAPTLLTLDHGRM